MAAKTLSGPSVKIFINNKLLGFVTGVELKMSSGRRPIYELDSVTPAELAPGPRSVNGVVSVVRIRLDGGLEGRGIAATDRNIMLEKYISITLVDRLTDTVIFKCEEAAVNDQSWAIQSKNIVTGTFTFTGKGWTNELENT